MKWWQLIGVGVICVVVLVLGVMVISQWGEDTQEEPDQSSRVMGMSLAKYASLTKLEFEQWLRSRDNLEDEIIERELRAFESNKATFTAQLARPTATPRVWTAAELVECDTTTLALGSQSTELLSECELAVLKADFEVLSHLEGEGDLTDAEMHQLKLLQQTLEIVKKGIAEVYADQMLTSAEVAYLCELMPQQAARLRQAKQDARSLQLLGLEVQVLRAEKVLTAEAQVCREAGLIRE